MLELRQLKISLNGKTLFSSLNLQVGKGKVACIMGPSGCGKSTLLAAISGTLSSDFLVAGDILLNDNNLKDLPLEKRRVGILFQDDLLFPHLDVFGNLAFALPSGMKKQQKEALIHDSLVKAGLDNFAKRDIATLSGGQKARVSLLRTLLASPQAVLLDEPFSKLDQELRVHFREFVQEQIAQLGIPALLVTHNKNDNLNGEITDLTSYQPTDI